MTIHIWNGHQILVESYAVPKFLWFCMAFSVQVDGIEKYTSPQKIEGFHTIVPFKILDNGNVIHGHVASGHPCTALHAAYRVFIENKEVANGSVRAKNWYMPYLIVGAIFAALVLFKKCT